VAREEDPMGVRKARASIERRQRDCRGCGHAVAIVNALDIQTSLRRTVVVESEGNPGGWLVLTDTGAFMDSDFHIEGKRYARHVCPEKVGASV
jgi:hypothetical protein